MIDWSDFRSNDGNIAVPGQTGLTVTLEEVRSETEPDQGWSIFKWHIDFTLPKSPPILGKFDLKHQFTSIFTKIFPIYLQDFQIFPLSKPSEML